MAFSFVKQGHASAGNVLTFSPTNAGDLLILVSVTSAGGGTPTLTSVVDNNSVSWLQALATSANEGGDFLHHLLPAEL